MAFSLREFIKKGFLNSVGKLADYQIILNAAGYLDRGVLTSEDLAEIQSAIDANNAPPPVPDADAFGLLEATEQGNPADGANSAAPQE